MVNSLSNQILGSNSPSASPYGWHDLNGVEGAEEHTTYGNNVKVGIDRNADDIHDKIEIDNKDRIFNYAFNDRSSVEENEKSSLTNIFYWMNLLHDTYYRFGFTESAGNFQMNNYDRGGKGGDMLIVDAIDGSGNNNAYFSTPPDGFIPKMETFLWNSSAGTSKVSIGNVKMDASTSSFRTFRFWDRYQRERRFGDSIGCLSRA